jgi:uncharacterized protein YraI
MESSFTRRKSMVQREKKHNAFLMFVITALICTMVMAFSAVSAHAATQKGTVNSKGGLNMRSGAGMKYKVICTIPNKASVTVKGVTGIWYKVSYNGKTGYVGKALVKTTSSEEVSRSKSISDSDSDSDSSSDSSSDDVSAVINKAVSWAVKTANDDSHGYSQVLSRRWGNTDYDCSTFVTSAYRAAGLTLQYGSSATTMNCGLMKTVYTAEGFKWIPWSKIRSVSNLKKGDVLLDTSAHTELYIGSGMNAAAHSNRGHAQAGDQTGTEVSVARYYNNVGGIHWDGVLRYVG